MKVISQINIKLPLAIAIILSSAALTAQGSNPDFFQSIGKIYVVVAVVLISFLGILFFLIYIDRKLKGLEEQMEE